MTKKELRAYIMEKKRALTERQIVTASEKLCQQFLAHPAYQKAKTIYGYLSYNQEVRTMTILKAAQADGKRIAVPKIMGDDMIFIWMDDLTKVGKGFRGIPEPIDDGPEALDPDALVMMPGLAFDPHGGRCGYGRGFYDKYLEKHPGHPTMAMCFDFQVFDRLETDEHDIPVDYLLTQEVGEP